MPTTEHFAALKMNKLQLKTATQIIMQLMLQEGRIFIFGLLQWLSDKEPACNAGVTGAMGLIPGSGRSSGGGHGYPFRYSCLENPMDRGAWRATIHSVTKNWKQLK
ncbi:unnamed protein product [Rangifer tarandus platyrhynchus]|uniref:Uncharacterized protein n=2 Tax=Rangifer tarandus platyrhynchus TaxID=3082113 RepID=A0AC59YDC8_RANTA|nr:unnamed protein product [Rangifer tarandus platyrhynchus]